MTAILAILMLLVLITLDLVKGARETKRGTATRPRFLGEYGTTVIERYMHPGHCWSLIHGKDPVLIGVDDFTQRLIGGLDSIDLPVEGTYVRQGEPLVTLHRGRRALTPVAPISGTVTRVNRRLKSNPARVNASPYESGWIASIAPSQLAVEMRNLLRGSIAERWEEAVRLQLLQSFRPALGTLLQDGGTFIDNIGDILTDEQWNKVVHEFYPTINESLTAKGVRS